MSESKRIVEVNGVKVEINLRSAKRVDEFKVGDAVKVLVKKYGDGYESHFGMIVGFDEFKSLPTIVIAYLDTSRWESPLKFTYINHKTVDAEICAHDSKDLGVSRADMIAQFDREILKKELELKEIHSKKVYFNEMFGRYFEKNEAANVG